MSVASKLNIKAGASVAVIGLPDGVDLELPEGVPVVEDAATASVVVAFLTTADDVDGLADAALAAAREDRVAWLAYPKAGQLGTDLQRDSLARLAEERGATPVRQVSINDVWSALRFRPGGKPTRWTA